MNSKPIISAESNQISDTRSLRIANRIKKERKAKNYSQRELAEKVHVKKDVIRRLETGERKILDYKTKELITYIGNTLFINPDYLLGISDNPLHPQQRVIPANQLDDYTNLPDRFIYRNGLALDFAYAAEYMHPDFQKELVTLVHSFVELHKCAVHFPGITKAEAQKYGHKRLEAQRLEDLLKSERAKSAKTT